MAGISSLGVGSGIDLETLVTKLMAVERQPLTRLQSRQTTYNSQISAVGQIKSAIASLQTAAAALKDPAKLQPLKASVADASIASASVSSGAGAGKYTLEVTQLATEHRSILSLSSLTSLSTKTLDIKVGTNAAVSVNVENMTSLSDIANAINGTANTGVTATVINGTNLVITSQGTGSANIVELGATDSSSNRTVLTSAQGVTASGGTNAELKIDGVSITSASNKIENAITGVSLDLAKTGTTTLSVANDSSELSEKVNTFVKAYNGVLSTLNTLSAYVPGGASGIFNGDSMVRSIAGQIQNAAFGMASGVTDVNGAVPMTRALSDLGVETTKDGTLTFNSAKLSDLLKQDASKVLTAISNYGAGIDTLTTKLNGRGGLVETRTEGIQQSLRLLDTQIESMNRMLEGTEKQYRARFTALDVLVARMQQTSNYLGQQITALNNNK